MKRILVFGDSNSWGHIPASGMRYAEDIRWPGVAQRELGEDYCIIEDSISGRTTIWDDPLLPKRCGKDNLGFSMLAQSPLDMIILAVGANDLKFTDASGAARGISILIEMVNQCDRLFGGSSPIFRGKKRILLISPPVIADEIMVKRPGHSLQYASDPSKQMAQKYHEVADAYGTAYLNAAALVIPSLDDCLHLTPESHEILGREIAEKIKEIFMETPE